MICRKILTLCFTIFFCAPAFAETDSNHGPKIYVPDYQLEKIYQNPAGDIYALRRSLRRMENFVELWARIIPRDHEEKTLDLWKSEMIPVDSNTAYAQVKLHFYCNSSEAAIPATYLFDKWSQLIDSQVVMLEKPFSTKDKPIIKRIKDMACNGELNRLRD